MLICIALLISLIIGYLLGLKKGLRLGYDQGSSEKILELRQQSLEENCCPLCSQKCDTESLSRP
jgi:DNA repair exonuclease SbcCD ATPase subunit